MVEDVEGEPKSPAEPVVPPNNEVLVEGVLPKSEELVVAGAAPPKSVEPVGAVLPKRDVPICVMSVKLISK